MAGSTASTSDTTSTAAPEPNVTCSATKCLINTLEDYRIHAMNLYAEAGEGVIFRFKPNFPAGDFAYYPHKWTARQRRRWESSRKAPCRTRNLSRNSKLLPQSVHIPTEKDRILLTSDNKVDVRISKEQFLRLEQITVPGARIWVSDPREAYCVTLLSHIFSFTQEEKEKYHNDKFKEDGSDLPTLNGLIERFQHGGGGDPLGLSSAEHEGLTIQALNELVGQRGTTSMCTLL